MLSTSRIVRSQLLLVALGLLQLQVEGAPDAACKNVPDYNHKQELEEKCCEMPHFFANETLHECWSGMEKSSKSHVQKSCEFSTCVLKKDNFLKSDGSMDVDRTRAFIKDNFKASSEWKSLVEKVIMEECMPMIEKDASSIRNMIKTSGTECDPTPAFLIACAVSKIYAQCPPSSWSSSSMCDEWKTYFGKCSNTVDDIAEMFIQIESRKLAEGQ